MGGGSQEAPSPSPPPRPPHLQCQGPEGVPAIKGQRTCAALHSAFAFGKYFQNGWTVLRSERKRALP